MKKFVLSSLCIVFVLGLFAQTDFYYVGNGKTVNCKIKKDMVVFKCQPETDIETLVKQSVFTSAYRFSKDLVIATIDTLKSNLEMVKNHRNITDATYALKCFDNELQLPNGNIFVRMKGGISPEILLDDAGLIPFVEKVELFNPYSQIYKVCLNVPLGDILQICRNLYELNQCEFVEPSFILIMKPPITQAPDTSSLNRNTPDHDRADYYPKQWGLHNDGSYPTYAIAGVDIKAEEAWSITKGNPNIKIAVIDEGVELNHLDLEDNILKDLGYDVFHENYVISPPPPGSNDKGDNHGTLCSGVICALDNNTGVVGVAPHCKIVPVRIAMKYTNNKTNIPGEGDYSWITSDEKIARGITYAWDTAKVDIMSISWGYQNNHDIIAYAFSNAAQYGRNGKGCIAVAATGNNSCYHGICFPSYLPYVIAVNGIYANGNNYGCTGDSLDITAPAVDIYTTDINSTYAPCEGTSLASPLVAGVAALMLSVNPNLTWQQVHYIIETTARKEFGIMILNDYFDVPELYPNGLWSNVTGYGLVNAHAAVLNSICYTGFPLVTETITENTLWNTGKHVNSTITIPNNVTLTITSTVTCDAQVAIIIQPGGKLIINGGTLTNACLGEMWQGVTVNNQGYIDLRNGGKIENAITGITAESGATVNTFNAHFINNLSSG